MTQALSLYLDALRFGAAFTVFVSHWAGARYSGGLSWRMMGYGRTSVIVPLRVRHRVGDRNEGADTRGLCFQPDCPALFSNNARFPALRGTRPPRNRDRSPTLRSGIEPEPSRAFPRLRALGCIPRRDLGADDASGLQRSVLVAQL